MPTLEEFDMEPVDRSAEVVKVSDTKVKVTRKVEQIVSIADLRRLKAKIESTVNLMTARKAALDDPSYIANQKIIINGALETHMNYKDEVVAQIQAALDAGVLEQ